MATREDLDRETRLKDRLIASGRVLVAFSGGVDSTYLLAVAVETLGAAAAAMTADSPSMPREDLDEAISLARALGAVHHVVPTDELDDPVYQANDGQRCAACKSALLRAMQALIRNQPADTALLLGTVTDDLGDYRPGLRAASERGAVMPMVDAGLDKAAVRRLSTRRGLPTASRPASPCLGSRFPYGEPVTRAGLAMIEAAERQVRALTGVVACRVRHHRVGTTGSMARIEVPSGDLPAVLARHAELAAGLRGLGYAFVSVDLDGLRSGGFNALLPAAVRAGGTAHDKG